MLCVVLCAVRRHCHRRHVVRGRVVRRHRRRCDAVALAIRVMSLSCRVAVLCIVRRRHAVCCRRCALCVVRCALTRKLQGAGGTVHGTVETDGLGGQIDASSGCMGAPSVETHALKAKNTPGIVSIP